MTTTQERIRNKAISVRPETRSASSCPKKQESDLLSFERSLTMTNMR
uniref:Uncharacterized protein n=1 Tax=Arundo donax TaxID=35708 RepID=A0A0A9DMI2_ARUDO